MGTMVTFFCTRCGVALEVEPESAGRPVRCGRCSTVVRTPAAVVSDVEEVPFARLAASAPGPFPPPLPMSLSYVPAWPERHERAVWLDQMARRLEAVTAPDEEDP